MRILCFVLLVMLFGCATPGPAPAVERSRPPDAGRIPMKLEGDARRVEHARIEATLGRLRRGTYFRSEEQPHHWLLLMADGRVGGFGPGGRYSGMSIATRRTLTWTPGDGAPRTFFDCTARDRNVSECPELSPSSLVFDSGSSRFHRMPGDEVPTEVEVNLLAAVFGRELGAPGVIEGGWTFVRSATALVSRPDAAQRTDGRPERTERVAYDGAWVFREGTREPEVLIRSARSEGVTCCAILTFADPSPQLEPRCVEYPAEG